MYPKALSFTLALLISRMQSTIAERNKRGRENNPEISDIGVEKRAIRRWYND